MALFALKAGAEIDLLTPDEFSKGLQSMADLMHSLATERRDVIHQTHEAITDASGNLGGGYAGNGWRLYTVPAGFEIRIERLTVNAQGYFADSPLTTGGAMFYRNAVSPSNMEAFLPVSGAVAPVIAMQEGEHAAIHMTGGEQVLIAGQNLPANLTMYFKFQICLYRRIPTPRAPLSAQRQILANASV